jgi:hypothetical protein
MIMDIIAKMWLINELSELINTNDKTLRTVLISRMIMVIMDMETPKSSFKEGNNE